MNLRLELLALAGRPSRTTSEHPPGTRVVIGSGRGAAVRLDDDEVAPEHCALEWLGSDWWARDLDGARGALLLNDLPLPAPTRVRPGDILGLGRTRLLIELGAVSAARCAGCDRARRPSAGPGLAHGRRWVCDACLSGRGRVGVLRIADWVEVCELGEGVYGRVLLAAGRGGERLAALKVAHADPFGDPQQARESQARFRREALTLRGLDHPCLVRLYDAGVTGELWWTAMELMEEDLGTRVGRAGALSPEHAARLGAELLAGLVHVHERGVLHRDVKPNNVLVGADGRARLCDFGLCSMVEATRVTLGELGVGTLHYAAPEQIVDSCAADRRSDLYGWGATVYFLLTGLAPYWWARGWAELVRAYERPPARPDDLEPAIPAELAEVVMRCLARDPADRPADAREALRLLEGVAA